jgi:MFS family permease
MNLRLIRISMALNNPGSEISTLEDGLWIRQLLPQERSAFVATFAGWMLDGMDVMVYSLVLPTLLTAWHITKGQAGLLSTATLLISSLGGWLAGILADRFGRVQLLKLTVFWFAFFTFLSGFTQNFEQLLLTRSLQGLGFGGEWAVGAALVSETIRARYRGRAVGTVQAGWSIGWGVSVLVFTLVFSHLPHEIGLASCRHCLLSIYAVRSGSPKCTVLRDRSKRATFLRYSRLTYCGSRCLPHSWPLERKAGITLSQHGCLSILRTRAGSTL